MILDRFAPRASLALIGLAWVLPFLQPRHSFPLTSFYGEWLAFALGLAAATMLLRRAAWREAALPWIVLAPFGLILLLGLQVALGRVPYPEQAVTATLYLLWAMLLIFLGRALRQELDLAVIADVLAAFLLAGGLLGAIVTFLQLVGVPAAVDFLVAERSLRASGNLMQPNHFAAWLALAVASAGYLHARERLGGWLCALCVAALMLPLALSGSRGAWLYLGLFLVLGAFLRHEGASGHKLFRFGLWLLPALALAHWITTLLLPHPAQGAAAIPADRLFETASGIDARLQLAREAWHIFLGSPWIGAGWGQFAWHHFLFLGETGPGPAPGICNHAHNVVLQLLAETGLAGALIVAGGIGAWLWDARRARPEAAWWWLMALLGVMAVHSVLEYPLWYSYFLGIAALLLGMGSRSPVTWQFAGAARLVASACVLAGWVNLLAVLGPNREFERLVFDRKAGAAWQLDEKSAGEALVRVGREAVLLPYVELVIAHGISVTPERLADKVEFNTRVMRFAPASFIVYREVLLLALAGRGAEARRLLERAASAYPHDLEEVTGELRRLATRHPGEFTPLLELAAAKSAELRARGTAR